MKREDLKKLLGDGATDETIDAIMKLHGTGVEEIKTKLTNAETERDQFKAQAETANQQIESFKGMKKPEEVEAAVTEWKTKYEQAQEEAKNQLAQVKFDHALESALTGAKAKNVKAVQALLSKDNLKLTDDGKILGLDDQLKAIKEQNDYLFESDKPAPRIVAGGNNQPIQTDAMVAAARKAAGLPVADEG